MTQICIAKVPRSLQEFRRPFRFFENARSAFRAFLERTPFEAKEKILLPAYVGWSPNEGSGVFDPVAKLGLLFDFYRLDDNLHIDLEHLRSRFSEQAVKVFVIIHYFGYIDPGYEEAVKIAREFGACILEDEAHAMLTDLISGSCGRLGDACIFSLHKMLPLENGGMLIVNQANGNILEQIPEAGHSWQSPWEFDLKEISLKRWQNARMLTQLLEPLAGRIDPLWGTPPSGQIPQTYPVILRHISREKLYFAMNEAGFGVVSLYHTLIKEISPDAYPSSHKLSKHILNLPVHQDVSPKHLEAMVRVLADKINSCSI